MRIAESNADQAESWGGESGEFWARRADRIDAGVARYQDRLLAAAGIEPGAEVLDVGCGSGQVTRDVARLGGRALGVDLSGPMLALARRLAAGQWLTGARFEQADAQVHPFPAGAFDVLLSRHGVMFFGDPGAAFANLAGALRPGGRLALLTWQPYERNEWLGEFRTALSPGGVARPPITGGPFSFSDPDVVRPLLTGAGFTGVELTPLAEPMWFGPDPADAFEFVTGQHADALAALDPADRPRAAAALRASLAAHQTADGVTYPSATWLITAVRR